VGGLILNENAFLLTLAPQSPGEPVLWEAEDAIALRQWQLLNASLTTTPGSSNTLDLLGRVGDRALTLRGTLPADHDPERWWLAVRDPAQYLLDTWRKELILAGITVNATQVRDRVPPSITGQMTLTSDPLADLIRDTNQPSSNVYAEALWLHLAHDATLPDTTPLEHSLTQLGVGPDTYKLADGSGLSRHNLVSPRAIAQTLHSIAHGPNAQVFQASLPVAGESGTLRRRFQTTPLAGQVWAKTGTLTGVSALSGYLRQPGQEALIFSIVLNQATVSVREQRQAIDAMVGAIATWQTCQAEESVQ
jgi:D-alanyl-D-alanine carboxypeptidase/D-alanyl-D-alanine-endopeptidase (penicillin-binding protein 4)